MSPANSLADCVCARVCMCVFVDEKIPSRASLRLCMYSVVVACSNFILDIGFLVYQPEHT